MNADRRYWFVATPFGLGWWRPSHWLGWLSIAVAIGLVLLAARVFPPAAAPLWFWTSIAGVAIGFLLVCWRKGEPLRTRRG